MVVADGGFEFDQCVERTTEGAGVLLYLLTYILFGGVGCEGRVDGCRDERAHLCGRRVRSQGGVELGGDGCVGLRLCVVVREVERGAADALPVVGG